MESTSAPPWEDGEWELHNDDGFVYKRRKRRTLEPQPDRPDPELAAAEAEASRKDRKRKALVKLRDQYRREIERWELLANTLRAMEENALQLLPLASLDDSSPSPRAPTSDSGCGSVVDELLLQVEAQEAIIRDASNLCDIAEAMCDAQEKEEYLSLIDLPAWAFSASPQKLLASLCDQ